MKPFSQLHFEDEVQPLCCRKCKDAPSNLSKEIKIVLFFFLLQEIVVLIPKFQTFGDIWLSRGGHTHFSLFLVVSPV